ncbi:MAG: hypothetical protein ACUVUC_14520 [Thermoguttaceae bacterium]
MGPLEDRRLLSVLVDKGSGGLSTVRDGSVAWGDYHCWSLDTTPPTADIVDVSPDPRSTPVEEIQIVFSQPVI